MIEFIPQIVEMMLFVQDLILMYGEIGLLLSKSIIRCFEDSRYSFFTACFVYRIHVPFLRFARVYFV